MKMTKLTSPSILWCIIAQIITTTALAKDDDFVVSIVPQQQVNYGRSDIKVGVPVVVVSPVSQRSDGRLVMDAPSENCFFVIIRNTKQVAVTNIMDASDWNVCLQFKMTDGNGKVYSVSRRPRAWYANGPVSWVFPSNGMRVIAVDFTNGALGGWQGLPAASAVPEIVNMTATFHYFDPKRKPVSLTSKATEVCLMPQKND
jgi:hypothetical protein